MSSRLMVLLVLVCVACSTTVHNKFGATWTAPRDLPLVEWPRGWVSEMDLREQTVGVLRAGERYEVRKAYRDKSHSEFHGPFWVLVVSLDRPEVRGWLLDELARAE